MIREKIIKSGRIDSLDGRTIKLANKVIVNLDVPADSGKRIKIPILKGFVGELTGGFTLIQLGSRRLSRLDAFFTIPGVLGRMNLIASVPRSAIIFLPKSV